MALEDNPALLQIVRAQQERDRKQQEEAAAERTHSGSAAQSSGGPVGAPFFNPNTALLAAREALERRRGMEQFIHSPNDLSDLRVRKYNICMMNMGCFCLMRK